MPSHLRLQSSIEEPIEAHATYQSSPSLPPKKKQRMSLTNTYMVASTARSKLGREAGRSDHNLRLLVGHANLLDSLMLELQEAEREQEAWFNQAVRKASKPEEPRRVQWMDQINEFEEDESSDDEDEGSEFDEEEELFDLDRPIRIQSPAIEITSAELMDDELDAEYDEDYEDNELSLQRSPSKYSPPELSPCDESDSDDSDSEDECPSPEDLPLQLSEKQRQAIATTAFYDLKSQRGLEHLAMQQPQQTIIAAC